MVKRKLLGVGLCAGVIVGVGVNPAAAGEITGNGKTIEVRANSICAYSGLDDDDDDGFDRTQNWGQIPKAERDFLKGVGFNPGVACNGHLNPYRGGGGH